MPYTFKVLGGHYVDHDGNTHQKGDIFESNIPELHEKFPNAIEEHHVRRRVETPVETPPVETPGPANPTGFRGVDVTEYFPTAAAADLTVLKKGRGWWVYGDLGDEPINDKPLKKGAVVTFIEDYMGE